MIDRRIRGAAGAMALTLSLAFAIPAGAAENRCGILSNPTPANWWLTDRDGEWIIGVQGGYQAEGIENIPEEFFEDGWISVNGSYGYRCGCLSVATDRKAMRIREVYGARALSMRRCNADKALQKALNRRR